MVKSYLIEKTEIASPFLQCLSSGWCLFPFETEPDTVAQAGLELVSVFLSQCPG